MGFTVLAEDRGMKSQGLQARLSRPRAAFLASRVQFQSGGIHWGAALGGQLQHTTGKVDLSKKANMLRMAVAVASVLAWGIPRHRHASFCTPLGPAGENAESM